MDLSLVSNWALGEYRRECVAVVDVKRFDFMAVDGRNLVKNNRSCSKCYTALSTWKRRCVVLSR